MNNLVTGSLWCTTHAVQYPQMQIIVLLKHSALYGAHLIIYLSDRPALRLSQIFCFKRRSRRRPSGHSSRKSKQHDADPESMPTKSILVLTMLEVDNTVGANELSQALNQKDQWYLRSTVYSSYVVPLGTATLTLYTIQGTSFAVQSREGRASNQPGRTRSHAPSVARQDREVSIASIAYVRRASSTRGDNRRGTQAEAVVYSLVGVLFPGLR